MSITNGVWHDAKLDPPKDGTQVLAVKELKDGRRDICLARYLEEYECFDPQTMRNIKKPYWVCGGNNNIIYWMPLPNIPKKEE